MGTSKQSNRQRGPGTVSLAALARHWRVVPATAKKICAERGIQDTETRSRARYRWQDVWRAEGAVNVDPALWEAYRAPLLKPKDLGDMFPELSERTIRRDLGQAAGRSSGLVSAPVSFGPVTSPRSSRSAPESAL